MPMKLKRGFAIAIFAVLIVSSAVSQSPFVSPNTEQALRGVWKLWLPGRVRAANSADVEIRLQFNGIQSKGIGRCSMGGGGYLAGDDMSVSEIAGDVWRRVRTKQRFEGGAFGGHGGEYRFFGTNYIEIEMIGAAPEKAEISISGDRLTTRFGSDRSYVWIKDRKESQELAQMLPRMFPDLIDPQSSPGRIIEPVTQSWPDFLVNFRAAVAKRDRAALRAMIASPFITQVDGKLYTPDDVINWLGQSKSWGELLKELRPGVRFTDLGGYGLQKCASSGIFCFKLEPDGRWRLSMQVEGALD